MKLNASFVALCVLVLAYRASGQVSTSEHAEHQKHELGQHAEMMHPGDMPKHMQMMNRAMVKHLGKSDPQYDARLIDMMIRHHEGAIMMFNDALEKSTHPEIKAMATKAIAAQQKEIDQLKKWHKAWYARPTGPQ